MKPLIFLILFSITLNGSSQSNTIAQLAIWKPNPGNELKFMSGYAQHLKWHKENSDTWNWYGWFFTSGPRAMHFLDGTFWHSWADFDNAVKPMQDAMDNLANTAAYASCQSVYKIKDLAYLGIGDSSGLKSRLLRYITIKAIDVSQVLKVVQELKNGYLASKQVKYFRLYQTIEGGDLNEMILFLGFNSNEEFGRTEDIGAELIKIEKKLKIKCINNILSETLSFRPELSINTR